MEEKDKKIVELETKLAKSEKERELDNSFWKQECDSLQKQLHDLPKKIVEEIKENNTYLNSSKPNQKNHIYDSYLIEAKTLDSILKKYGGKK